MAINHTRLHAKCNALVHLPDSYATMHIPGMSGSVKAVLQNLMLRDGDTPTSLSKKTEGTRYFISQPTLSRILNGDDDRATSPQIIERLVGYYGLSEAQIRGLEPMLDKAPQIPADKASWLHVYEQLDIRNRQMLADIAQVIARYQLRRKRGIDPGAPVAKSNRPPRKGSKASVDTTKGRSRSTSNSDT